MSIKIIEENKTVGAYAAQVVSRATKTQTEAQTQLNYARELAAELGAKIKQRDAAARAARLGETVLAQEQPEVTYDLSTDFSDVAPAKGGNAPRAVPVAENVAVPVSENVVVPVSENAVIPVAENAVIPVVENVAVPAAENVAVPVVGNDPRVVPVTKNVAVPVAENVAVPVVGNDPRVVPIAENGIVPVAENGIVPVAKQGDAGNDGCVPVTVEPPKPVKVKSMTESEALNIAREKARQEAQAARAARETQMHAQKGAAVAVERERIERANIIEYRPPQDDRRGPRTGGYGANSPGTGNRQFGDRKPFDNNAPRPGAPRPGVPRPGAPRPGARPAAGDAPPIPSKTERRPAARKPGEDRTKAKKSGPIKEKIILDDDDGRGYKKRRRQVIIPVFEPIVIEHAVITGDTVSVKTFAERTGKPASEIIKKLLLLGIMSTINSEIDFDTASLVAGEFRITLEQKFEVTAEDVLIAEDTVDEESDLITRNPVVTIMGHVDHGKTSLLDKIRSTKVTEGEAGGITQHIGAYTVEINGKQITFLDTPGHEAFTAMRARGAQVTDIAILVVAADDGVMPQTKEAINHAKAAGVPIIVAINKTDKEGANPERVKQELTEYELVGEEWGGDVIMAPVSAKTGEGVEHLLEMILLQAEVLELKANPNRQAKGTVVEARLDKGRGPVATVLVQNGTLRTGDTIVAGMSYGKVRAMLNDVGQPVTEAGPSQPVEVIGFSDVPTAGDVLTAVKEDKLSRQVAEERKDKVKAERLKSLSKISLEDLFSKIEQGQIKDLNIIVKADVQGSVEAVKQSLEKLTNDEVRVKVIHGAVGAIREGDVLLASASGAIIIGFNVRPDAVVAAAAEREGVDIRLYRVIYNAIEDIELAMKGMLAPEFREVVLGHAEVRQTFKVSGIGTIAGSYVKDGKIVRNSGLRLLRDGIIIHEGKLNTLRRFKDDVKEVATGFECGITVENWNDVLEGDVIEAYIMEEIKR